MSAGNPSSGELSSAFKKLEDLILAAVDAEIAKLPAGLQPSAAQVEAIVKRVLDNFNWDGFQQVMLADLTSLVLTGRSQAPHDPTELA